MVSAVDFLHDAQSARGKVVFIGSTAAGLGDSRLTPVSSVEDPGVTIHAAATESLVRGDVLTEVPPIVAGLLAGFVVLAILRFHMRRIIAVALLVTDGTAKGSANSS